VLLDNIRSALNVGSILRTADGFGFEHAYLCGISASPTSAEVRKTSLGAEANVAWSLHPDGLRLCRQLKEEGFHILALETAEGATDLKDWKPRVRAGDCKIVLVLGNEVTGIDPGILQASDEVVCLPMHGQKRSFNVAVSFGIAGFQIRQMCT
jgi:tRNA G18 (ribose-2'-O)-methylase SpoU